MPRSTVELTLLGLNVVFDCPDEATAAQVRSDWARCSAGAVPGAVTTSISVGSRDESADDGRFYLATSTLTQRVIERCAGSSLMLHACGLSSDDRVLVLVAPSGTGKSTAAAVLGRTAFGYVTDETVVIDEDLSVRPYPKPLSLIDQGSPAARRGKLQCGPDELGLRQCQEPLELGRLVILHRPRESTTAHLQPVALLDAILELIPQTSALASLFHPLQRLARAIDCCEGVTRLAYSEISEAEPLLVALMAATIPSSEREPWSPVESSAQTLPLRDGRLFVRYCQDAIIVGDEVLLLKGGVPMRLSGIGATIWLGVTDGVVHADLVDYVTGIHGSHPSADHLVSQAVRDLIDAGALAQLTPVSLAHVMAGASSDEGGSLAAGTSEQAR